MGTLFEDSDRLRRLPALGARWRAGDLAPAVYVTLYVLHWQAAHHGRRLAQRRSRRDPLPDGPLWVEHALGLAEAARAEYLAELLDRYALRGLRPRVGIALSGWLRGAWELTLTERIPSPRQVLQMQAAGTRPVTVIADYPRLLDPVLDKADAFAFVCHDLEHAWQFFHDPARHAVQRRFARRLAGALAAGAFAEGLADPVFARKFDYLAADMNTHVVHSLQYLRAILLEFHLRREGKAVHESLSEQARDSLRACLGAVLGTDGADEFDPLAALLRGRLSPREAAALEAAVCPAAS